MQEVGGVTSNDTEDVIVKVPGKLAVSEILTSKDDIVIGTAVAQMVAPKEVINHMHGVDHVVNGRLAVARYILGAENVHAAADQETNEGKRIMKLTEKGFFVGRKTAEAESKADKEVYRS